MSRITVDGFTPDDQVPGFAGQMKFGVGKPNVGAITLKCTLFGNKTAAGTAVIATKVAVSNPEDAATLLGPTSELARMAYAALDVPGSTVECVPVAEAGGGAAGTATITFAGSQTTSGYAIFQCDEQIFTVNFAATDTTPTLAAVAFVAAFNALQNGRFFATAANASGVVTLTTANVGIRNLQHTLFVIDKTKAPSGMTIAIAGGTALANGGVPFTGASGADDITTAITAFDSVQLDYIAAAHNDATNAGVLETHANSKAAFDVGLYDQYVLSGNSTQAAAIAIAQTQMNDQLGQFVWVPFGVEHPSRIAARVAAIRSVSEGANPNINYNGVVLPKAAPHFRDSDSPSRPTKKAALNAGMTILETVNGKMVIVRAVNSHSLNGSTPDKRTFDSSDTSVTIRVTKELKALYIDAAAKNPYAGPDLTDDMPPEARFTPRLWQGIVTSAMKDFEKANWVTDVDNNPTVAEWDPDGKRVMSSTPSLATLHNNSVGAVVNQVPA